MIKKKHAIVAKISDDIENFLHMCKTHSKRNKKEVLENNSLKVRTDGYKDMAGFWIFLNETDASRLDARFNLICSPLTLVTKSAWPAIS